MSVGQAGYICWYRGYSDNLSRVQYKNKEHFRQPGLRHKGNSYRSVFTLQKEGPKLAFAHLALMGQLLNIHLISQENFLGPF